MLGVRAFVLVFVPERRLTRSRSRSSEGGGGGARRSRRRDWTNRVGRASKYKREIDGEGERQQQREQEEQQLLRHLQLLMVLGVECTRLHPSIGGTCPGRGQWYARYRDRRPVERRGRIELGVSALDTRRKVESGKVEKWKSRGVGRLEGRENINNGNIHTLLQVGERQLGG